MHSKPRGGDVTSKCKDALPKKSEHASLPTCGREKKASVSIVGPKASVFAAGCKQRAKYAAFLEI